MEREFLKVTQQVRGQSQDLDSGCAQFSVLLLGRGSRVLKGKNLDSGVVGGYCDNSVI